MRKTLLRTLLKANNRKISEIAREEGIDWNSAYNKIQKLLKKHFLKKNGKEYMWTLAGRREIIANLSIFSLSELQLVLSRA